jgi:hypothetical protein
MIINDLVPALTAKVRSRYDLVPNMPYYLAVAILDITENTEFEQLKTYGPISNFIVGQSTYPLQGYDPTGVQGNPFVQDTNARITFITDWFVWFNTSGNIQPVNSTTNINTGNEINKRDIRVVRPMSVIPGLPTVYVQHGDYDNKGNILVGFMPDNPYACQMTYQKEHPFNIPYGQVMNSIGSSTLNGALGSSRVYMPKDWSDIIVYYAAEKLCDDNGMNEIANGYHQKLFGYKDKKGSEMPGLITVKQTQQERNTMFNSRQMRPIVRRYTG